ncbi:hypothetical protein HPP92_028164 [Vanilla planifolia]|uniref:IST1-like protein n=1 Tax=Vanilla planifolia TaxID=51239 RepID=A0A835P6C8_VANPL|nr:hypothetical protein HPP92_028164 [Vanilla planifolia]
MGRILDALLGRSSRQVTKLKTILGVTVTRLAILRNYRHTRCAQAQADVAHLLLLGHQDRALLRVEMVIKERNMLDVLAMVEGYCNLLIERAFLLQNQKECPEELREAAAGLSFAASRCGDLPELREVRRIFSSRFGKEFTSAAAELRNNCGMVQKFSTKQPDLETRVKVTKEIAMEKGIKVELTDPQQYAGETDPKPVAHIKNQTNAASPEPPLTAARCVQELLGDETLSTRAREKYKDAESAALAAFESAAYAAVAAKRAVELYLSESRHSDDPNKPFVKLLTSNAKKEKTQSIQDTMERDVKQHPSPDYNNPNCVDIGCRKYKVSSVRIESDKSRGKGILYEESDDEIEEMEELGSKALVMVTRAQSFAGVRGDFTAQYKKQVFQPKRSPVADGGEEECTLREKGDEMAIVAVDPPTRGRHIRHHSERGWTQEALRSS